ncbi:MAG: winged helix-turn-helix transcriptional regulator [Myxococcota bacterium]
MEPRRKAAALVLRFEEVGARQVVRVRGAKRRRLPDGAVLYRDARGRGLVLDEHGRITALHEEVKAARIAEAVLDGKRVRGLRLEEEGEKRNEVRSDSGHAEVEAKWAERARHALRVLSGERVDTQRRERAVLLQGHPARYLRRPEPESADPNQGVRRVRGSDDGRSDGGGRLERRDHVTELPDAVEGLSSDEVPRLVMEALRRPAPKVLEVDDEMVLEVRSVGQGEGLELGRAAEEPEIQPQLNAKPSAEPKVKETEPPPPAAPSRAEDEAQKRKRQRTEKTSRALREAERKRVLEVVKSGKAELDQIAAQTNLSERVCKRRLRELEREGLLKSDGASKWSLKGHSKKRDFDMGM